MDAAKDVAHIPSHWSGNKALLLIGADEAGRGPLSGPVSCAACAVYLPPGCTSLVLHGALNDSKVLSPKTRGAIVKDFMQKLQVNSLLQAPFCSVVKDMPHLLTAAQPLLLGVAVEFIDVQTIDSLNILNAAMHGIALSAYKLLKMIKEHLAQSPLNAMEYEVALLIDGPHSPLSLQSKSDREARLKREQVKHVLLEKRCMKKQSSKTSKKEAATSKKKLLRNVVRVTSLQAPLKLVTELPLFEEIHDMFCCSPQCSVSITPVIKGDAKCATVAAASVFAKEARDEAMRTLHELHPEYGWAQHMGYPTRQHILAIKKHGVSPHHRRSFGPVANAVGADPIDKSSSR